MSHERCPQWDSVTLAIALVTARCWRPPDAHIVVEVPNALDLVDALMSLCAALLQATVPNEAIARGLLHTIAAHSTERATMTTPATQILVERENWPND
jgi:hypothetical protein